jgi:hypothetical protein
MIGEPAVTSVPDPSQIVPRFELDRLISYDHDSLVAELRRVADLCSGERLSRNTFDRYSRVSSSTLVRRFGGWKEALDVIGRGELYGGKLVSAKMRQQVGKSLTEEDIICELKRLAAENSTTVVRFKDLKRSPLLSPRVVVSRFGTWKAAVEAAGLTLSNMGRRWSDADYFENLLAVWTHYGRPPRYREMDLAPSRITSGAYERKFGTWGRAKVAFVERVNTDIAIDQKTEATTKSEPIRAVPRQEDQRHISIGLRYQVLRRDRFRCVLCGRSPATDLGCQLHVDHTIAFSRGGKTRIDNLRTLCADCNVGKGDRD